MSLREENGNVLIIVCLAITVLFGFTALAVDGGYLYFRHTKLQDIDDAVSIAAAHGIVQTSGNSDDHKKQVAFDEAVQYAQNNNITVGAQDATNFTAAISSGADSGTMTVSFPNGITEVKVDMKLNTQLFFARAIDKNSTPVAVTSTAKIGQADKQTGGLLPVGIVANDPLHPDEGWVPGQPIDMTLGPSFGSSGNYGYLNFGDPNMFNEYIKYGYDGTLEVGQTVATYPGVDAGLVAHAIADRLAGDTDTLATYTSHPNCPRLVYVPIVDTIGDTGTSEVRIVGFAAFFLEGYWQDGNSIHLEGEFVGTVSPAEITPSSFEDYSVKSIRLIN